MTLMQNHIKIQSIEEHCAQTGCDKFKCDKCQYQTKTQNELNMHIKTNHEHFILNILQTKEFKCVQCKFEAETILSLNLHRKADHVVQVKKWFSKA